MTTHAPNRQNRTVRSKVKSVGILLVSLAVVISQTLYINQASADSNGYLWDPGAQPTGAADMFGYLTCPSNDTGCMHQTSNGYGISDPWLYWFRQCTSYVAWKINQVFNINVPTNLGDANTWWQMAKNDNFGTVYPASNYTPQIGDIADWVSQDHVAYVYAVNNGIASLDEYNVGLDGNFYTNRTTANTPGNAGTPDYYIHVGTPGLGGGNGSTWASGRLDAWIEQSSPTNGSNLGHVVWTGTTWNPWETIPASNELMTTQPAAVSWSSSRIDVFARGQAGDLIHTWTDNPNDINAWNPWESLGGCIIGSPTVTSFGVGRLDVFAEGCNSTGGNLWHTWYDSSINPNNWQPWENIETSLVMTSPPSAVSWAPGRIDVFARGTDSSLMHTFYDGNWESVLSLGGCIQGSPAASAWAPQRLDVFVEGCNATGGNFYHTFWDGQWNPYDLVNSSYQVSGVLGAVSWGYQRIDMFTRRSDNTLDHWWYDQNGWNGPVNQGGSLAS